MSDMVPQKPPEPGRDSVYAELHKLLEEREAYGIGKYATSLFTFNGRDALLDAIQEHVDEMVYLTQWRIERATLIELLAECAHFLEHVIGYGPNESVLSERGTEWGERLRTTIHETVGRSLRAPS